MTLRMQIKSYVQHYINRQTSPHAKIRLLPNYKNRSYFNFRELETRIKLKFIFTLTFF